MSKYIMIVTYLFFLAPLAYAADLPKDILKQADQFFLNHDYDKATELYENILRGDIYNVPLLMRLTKAYYLKEDFAHSDAAYLAAHRLSPRNHEVLEWQRTLKEQNKDLTELNAQKILGPFWGRLIDAVQAFSRGSWVALGFLLGVCGLLMMTCIKLKWLNSSLISLGYFACFLSCLGYGAYYTCDYIAPQFGIVSAQEGEVYTGLGAEESIIAKIPVGTPVQVLKVQGEFYKISFLDGSQRGWMRSAHLAFY